MHTGHSVASDGSNCPACGQYIAAGRPVVDDYSRQQTVCWDCSGRTMCLCCNLRNDVVDGFCCDCRAAGVTVGVMWQHRWGTGRSSDRNGERTARNYWRPNSGMRHYDVARRAVAGYIVAADRFELGEVLREVASGTADPSRMWITPITGLTPEWLEMSEEQRVEALRLAMEGVPA